MIESSFSSPHLTGPIKRTPECNYLRLFSFRKKDVYSKGTKKQKMMISKAAVESIYSMEPPGRFLKKCADTGQWIELSKREAADKAAQAMAYVVRARVRGGATKERSALDLAATATQQSSDRPLLPRQQHVNTAQMPPAATAWGERCDTTHASAAHVTSASDHNNDSESDPGGRNELLSSHFSLQQQLPPWQQSTSGPEAEGAPLDGLAQTVSQAQLLQQYHQRQLSLWYHIMSQHCNTGLLPDPSSSAGLLLPPPHPHLRQGNYGYGMGAQLSTLLQSQANNMHPNPTIAIGLQSVMDQMQRQRGAMLQQHLLSSLTGTISLPSSQQQYTQLHLPQQPALLQQTSSHLHDPPPSIINSVATKSEKSAMAAVPSTRDTCSKGETEDDQR